MSEEGREVPVLALSLREAAQALSVSEEFLRVHVLPELDIVYRGRRRLIAVRELERWLEEQSIPGPRQG